MNKQRGSLEFSDMVGIVITICIVSAIVHIILRAMRADDPCIERNIAFRQTLIEAHERCMVEENCIYEDWDIRRYDRRLAQQEACKLED